MTHPAVLRERILSQVSRLCRESYILSRTHYESQFRKHRGFYQPGPRWDGGRDRDGRERAAIWPTVANFMLAYRLNPLPCIQARFIEAGRKYRPVWPNQLAQTAYLDFYREHCQETDVTTLNGCFTSQQAAAGMALGLAQTEYGLTAEEAIELVLLGDDVVLSPLFAYCLGISGGRRDLAAHFAGEALLQYGASAATYQRSVWRPWLPDWLEETLQLFRPGARREGKRA